MAGPSIIERAYQLTRSGQCGSVEEIARKLKAEQFESVAAHLAGTGLRRDLQALMRAARPKA